MRYASLRLMLALVNEHMLRLIKDLKRDDLTAEGRANYTLMLHEARIAREELEREVLSE